MNTNCQQGRSARAGFNRVELIAIVAVVAILALLAVLGSAQLKEKALRAHCRANLGTIARAFALYAADNNGLLPDCSQKNPAFSQAAWPWDMNTNLSNDLMAQGVTRADFYCPANPGMNDVDHWDFWRLVNKPKRVVGYASLLYGVMTLPVDLSCSNLLGNNGRPPAKTEMTMDPTVNEGGDYTAVKGRLTDRSNHLKGTTPLGGNINFEDGHAEWRDFKDMQHRFSSGGNIVWDY